MAELYCATIQQNVTTEPAKSTSFTVMKTPPITKTLDVQLAFCIKDQQQINKMQRSEAKLFFQENQK
jgi:hypothetical protein